MAFVVFHHGKQVGTLTLEKGRVYKIGRQKDCDVQIIDLKISRVLGYIKEGKSGWIFSPGETSEGKNIPSDGLLNCGQGVEIGYLDHVVASETFVGHRVIERRPTAWPIKALASVLVLAVVGSIGFYFYKQQRSPMNSNQLMSHVREKVVEFEVDPRPEIESFYKEHAKLEDKDFKTSVGFCTGFIVAPKVVLTAYHCLTGSGPGNMETKFYLKSSDESKHKVNRVLGFDSRKDFVYLEVDSLDGYKNLKFAKDFYIGQKVYTVGNVGGEGIAIREGIISGETEDTNHPEIKLLRYSAAASPGNSGGPLLNERGEIVALVFARNHAENHNLGTSVHYLREGFDQFVEDQSEKQASMDPFVFVDGGMFGSKRKIAQMFIATTTGLPLPYGATDEQLEIEKHFDDFVYDIKVPAEFTEFMTAIDQSFFAKAEEVVAKVNQDILSEGGVGLSWFEVVNKDQPLVLVHSPTALGQTFFKQGGTIERDDINFLMYPTHSDYKYAKAVWEKERLFRYEGKAYPTRIVRSRIRQSEWPKDVLYYSNRRDASGVGRTGRFFAASDIEFFRLKTDKPITDFTRFPNEFFPLAIAGSQGIALSTGGYGFVRPSAVREFNLKELPNKLKDLGEVNDESGRIWKHMSYSITPEVDEFDVYCTTAVKGYYCEINPLQVRGPAVELYRKNYIKTNLSHVVAENDFYELHLLDQVFKSDSLSKAMTFADFNYNKDKVNMKQSGLSYKLAMPGKSLKSVRFISGIRNINDEAKMVGLGIEGLYEVLPKGKKGAAAKSTYELCAMGWQDKGRPHMNILEQKRGSSGRDMASLGEASLEKNQFWSAPIKSKLVPSATAYGYCIPLKTVSGFADRFELDVKAARPHKVAVQ